MSIKVATQIWQGSKQKSGNLLVLLALADHADDEGKAWPGIPLLARKARLSERHVRRCLNQLVGDGEVTVLTEPAPSGGRWYQIRLDQLGLDNLSTGSSTAGTVTPMSGNKDADGGPYIREPSFKPSEEPSSPNLPNTHQDVSFWKKNRTKWPAIGLVSAPKNGF